MIYRTNSLQLASYLSCQKDLSFSGVDRSDPEKVAFLFEPNEEAVKLSEVYFAGKAKVNPLKLFEKYRTLKDYLFEFKREYERKPKPE